MVHHDLALAMNHADHVLVLHEGRLAAAGPPADTLTPETIANVWGVSTRWLGEPGQFGLIAGA